MPALSRFNLAMARSLSTQMPTRADNPWLWMQVPWIFAFRFHKDTPAQYSTVAKMPNAGVFEVADILPPKPGRRFFAGVPWRGACLYPGGSRRVKPGIGRTSSPQRLRVASD